MVHGALSVKIILVEGIQKMTESMTEYLRTPQAVFSENGLFYGVSAMFQPPPK